MGQPPCVIYWLDDARGQGSGSPCVIYFFALRHLPFHCVLSEKHNVCFPQSTMCALHKAQCVLSTKHSVCFPQSTMCAFHKAQCVLPTKHNVCFPPSTMCACNKAQWGKCPNPLSMRHLKSRLRNPPASPKHTLRHLKPTLALSLTSADSLAINLI